MWGTIKVRVHNEKPTDNLQMKRQVYIELNGFSAYKISVQQFVDQLMCSAH
jgi:heme-binding NEAT domain protein